MGYLQERPDDYPNQFVVRLFLNNLTTTTLKLADGLEEARSLVPIGKERIERHPSDPPSLVESWL